MNITSLQDKLNKLFASDSLKARAALGGLWLGTGNGVEQLLRFVRNMILTRILAPEAFGVMAIVHAVNTAFESFTEIGIRQAIIQNPRGHETTYLNGAWFFSCARSCLLYIMAFTGAPYIARFYNDPALTLLLRIAFLTILFNGLVSADAYLAVKKMRFGRWALAWHGGSIVGIIATIILSFYMRNVWALVIGFTSEAAVRLVLSYVLFPFVPRFAFDRDHLRSLLKFSRGMFGLPILTFIFLRTDIFVIGKLCPISDLGMYSMAATLAAAPFQFVSIASQVMMPAFSEKQTDTAWINKWIFNITQFLVFAGMPLLVFTALYGRNILHIVYGEQYGAVAVPFAIIFSTQLIYSIGVPIATVYLSIGRPELHRVFTALRTVIIVLLIVPAIKAFGLPGAAAAGLIAIIVAYWVQINRLARLIGFKVSAMAALFPKAACASLGIVVVWFATNSILYNKLILNIVAGVVGCLISYGAVAVLFYYRRKSVSKAS